MVFIVSVRSLTFTLHPPIWTIEGCISARAQFISPERRRLCNYCVWWWCLISLAFSLEDQFSILLTIGKNVLKQTQNSYVKSRDS